MKIYTLFILLLIPFNVKAWSKHGLLARTALEDFKPLQNLNTEYIKLEAIIPKMELPGVKTEKDLNLYLKIKKDSLTRHGYVFEPRLNEKVGESISALEVLSYYSDEPDGWSDGHAGGEPDTYLFEEGQYPELWKEEFSNMGGKVGTASQSFRHMWWSKWDPRHPIATFKLPPDMLNKENGEAHQRLQLYVNLSRAAAKAGSVYWQMRFLANGMHYIQDCTQPFHVSQTSTKKLIFMASTAGGWKGASNDFGILVKRTTQLVAYYHWSYEELIGQIFVYPERFPIAHETFSKALKKSNKIQNITNYETYLKEVAKATIVRSPIAGKTSIEFFPTIPKSTDLTTFDPNTFMNEAWWVKVQASAAKNDRVQKKYFDSVRESFELFGEAVRSIVKTEIK